MNKAVGERTVIINGQELLLRPDFTALVQIENLTNKSVIKLLDNFTNPETMRLGDTIIILFSCAQSGGYQNNLQVFASEVIGMEVTDLIPVAAELLTFVMSGGKKKEEPKKSEQLDKAQET